MRQSVLLPLALLMMFSLGAIDSAWLYWVHDVSLFAVKPVPISATAAQPAVLLSNEYAKSFWLLPARATGYWLVASLVLIACAWTFRNTRPAIRVYALVTERIAELMTSVGLLALSAQFAVYGAVYAYAEMVLYTDPRPFDSLKAIGSALLIYLPLAVGGLYAATAIARNTLAGSFRVHRELTASVRHAAKTVRHYRAEPLRVLRGQWPRCDLLFIADLHITRPGVKTVESTLDCAAGLVFVEQLIRQTRPRLVVACGDVTDLGDPEAIQRANRFFTRLGVPVVGTPGNHDVQFERMNVQHSAPLPYLRGLLSRSLRDADGDRRGMAEVDAPSRQQALQRNAALSFGTVPVSRYPALHRDPVLGVDLLLLDSNRRQASSPITNAIGYVGDDQLAAAAVLLRDRAPANAGTAPADPGTDEPALPPAPLIIVLHHHLVLPRLTLGALTGTYFQTCTDAAAVLAFARAHRASAIVHGHLHMPNVLRPDADPDAPTIVSCGSALFTAVGPNASIGSASAFGMRIDASGDIEILTYAAR